jgi:hypothetical protein
MERTYKKTSDDIRKRFCESIDNGSSRKDASRIMGVPDYTDRKVLDRIWKKARPINVLEVDINQKCKSC